MTTEEQQKHDYKNTLNLPQTALPMRANATQKEPEIQKFWESINVYEKNLAQRDKTNSFVLHDGPPYLSSEKIPIENRKTVIGKVIERKVDKVEDDTEYMATVAEYTVNGNTYTIESNDISPTDFYLDDVGAKVKITYDTSNPQNAFYMNSKGIRLIDYIISSIASFFALIGIICIYKILKSIFKTTDKIIYYEEK